jgi:adenylate cyclase
MVVTSARLRVGAWRLDRMRNEIAAEGRTVRLEPKAVEVLAYLAARPGAVVPREELLAAVWPGVVVGDDTLTQAIIKLRKALGDDAHQPRYIETISKRGYRLIASVEGDASTEAPVAAAWKPAPRRRPLFLAASALVAVSLLAVAVLTMRGKWPAMPWPIATDIRGQSASAPIVAVLPLANLSGDPRREYFSDGVTEDIISGLGRFSGVRVMSLAAVGGFRGKSPAPSAVQRELGARYIVTGSVREEEGRLRVAVSLADAEHGELLWSGRFDGQGLGLFEVQDRIVRGIVSALHVRLTDLERKRTFARPTESLEAHDLVLQARWLLYRHDRRANREARALLGRALQLAPDYGEAIVSLGEAEVQRALYGWVPDPADAMKRGEELATRVIASADSRSHARAHSLLASIYSNLARTEDSMRHAELALAANPSDVGAQYRLAAALLHSGRIEESIAAHEAAQRFQPKVGPGVGVNFVFAYYMGERYREALGMADTLLAEFPGDVALHALRAATLGRLGRADEAREAIGQVRRLSPGAEVRHFGTRFREDRHAEHLRQALRAAGLE